MEVLKTCKIHHDPKKKIGIPYDLMYVRREKKTTERKQTKMLREVILCSKIMNSFYFLPYSFPFLSVFI